MRNIILMICILVSLFQTNAQDFISCNECERTVGDSSAVQEVLEEQIPLVEAVVVFLVPHCEYSQLFAFR